MAKSRSFFGLRRGSTRSHTFQVVRGQQVTKDRVTDVANPRSLPQQIQRSRFGYITKFYSSALKNFFKFAFEDKKPTESDYNAFVRNNMDITPYATKEMLANVSNPFFAPFLVTKGTLPSLDNEVRIEDGDAYLYQMPASTAADLTVGVMSARLIAEYGLLEGDIVTFVAINGAEDSIPVSSIAEAKTALGLLVELPEGATTSWKIIQFAIDSTSTVKCTEIGFKAIEYNGGFVPGVNYYSEVFGVIFCVSRPSTQGLKVSNARITLTESLKTAYEVGISSAWGRFCGFNLGGNNDAILKGALIN